MNPKDHHSIELVIFTTMIKAIASPGLHFHIESLSDQSSSSNQWVSEYKCDKTSTWIHGWFLNIASNANVDHRLIVSSPNYIYNLVIAKKNNQVSCKYSGLAGMCNIYTDQY